MSLAAKAFTACFLALTGALRAIAKAATAVQERLQLFEPV